MDKIKATITLAKRNLVSMIYNSTQVEGLSTSYLTTDAILNNQAFSVKHTDDVLFILNMKRAYHFIFENLDYNNCWMLVRELNKIVGQDLIYNCGELRKQDVSIGGTKWKPTVPVDTEVFESIKMLNTMEDAESKAIAYFCYICRSQLFIDGNKRVAQLMANKVLIENGIGVFSIPADKTQLFKKLLLDYYETNDAKRLCQFLKSYCIERV